jgi:hypothetical protein
MAWFDSSHKTPIKIEVKRPQFLMVRERGLEPPYLTALAPKASVSTIPPLALTINYTALGHVPRPRNFAIGKPVAIGRFPCNPPQAALT